MKRLIPSGVLGLLTLGALLLAAGGSLSAHAAPAAGPAGPAAGCEPVWQAVPGPAGPYVGAPSGVAALARNDVWVVGLAPTAGKQGLIMHWDGRAWQLVPAPADAEYDLIGIDAAAPNDIWAVGYTNNLQPAAVHWDGVRWNWIPVQLPVGLGEARLYRVAARTATDAWAVGLYVTPTAWKPLIMHWDGVQWSIAYSGTPGVDGEGEILDVTASAANDAWAVGRSSVLHWDGQQWARVAVPYPGSFNGITANAPNDVWLVGNGAGTLIVHWDGTSWTQVPSPSMPLAANDLWNVRFAAPNDGWANGVYQDSAGWGLLLLHWDGVRWTLSHSPIMSSYALRMYGLAIIHPGEAWAVGWSMGSPDNILAHLTQPCIPPPPGAAPSK